MEIVIGACFLIDILKVAKFQWEVFSRFCFFDGNEREVFLKIQVTRVEGFLHSRCVCYAGGVLTWDFGTVDGSTKSGKNHQGLSDFPNYL